MTTTEADAWQQRYDTADTPWDLGAPAPALLAWLATNPGAGRRALVPGCGRGHDAVALAAAGWDVVAVDFAASAVEEARATAARAGHPIAVLQADLFALTPSAVGTFDLWFEHTCFCAIEPADRGRYAAQAASLVRPGGRLVGVFYAHGKPGGPPHDTRPEAVRAFFSGGFSVEALAVTPHSVERRAGQELWAELTRKD
jgi:SAM-dependent methyltransferase